MLGYIYLPLSSFQICPVVKIVSNDLSPIDLAPGLFPHEEKTLFLSI
jgi:hypothetical protein